MRSMHVDYIKQGKSEVYVNFNLDEIKINEIKSKLEKEPQCLEVLEVEIRDAKKNLISIAKLEWQLKDWKRVES